MMYTLEFKDKNNNWQPSIIGGQMQFSYLRGYLSAAQEVLNLNGGEFTYRVLLDGEELEVFTMTGELSPTVQP